MRTAQKAAVTPVGHKARPYGSNTAINCNLQMTRQSESHITLNS